MLSKYDYYEYRPVNEKTDLFAGARVDCTPHFIYTRIRKDIKVGKAYSVLYPWVRQMAKISKLYRRSKGKLLFTYTKRSFL